MNVIKIIKMIHTIEIIEVRSLMFASIYVTGFAKKGLIHAITNI